MESLKNILLLNAGTRNVLVRDFLNSSSGKCDIIVTDSYNLAPTLYETSKHYVTKKWDEYGYWNDIENICIKEDIGLIVSLIDPELELLAEQKERFEKMGILLNISNEHAVKSAFDKFETLEFLRKNNYPWINSYVDFDNINCRLESGDLKYPLIAKPRKGSGSVGIKLLHNIRELKEIFNENEDILIQEYMDGQEIGVDVYVDLLSDEVISIFAKRKLKMRAGETDKSVSFKSNKLFSLISNFVKQFGLKGTIDIDVFEKDGTFFISEVNPRFGGGYIHAYALGEDFPTYLINNMNGIENKIRIGKYREDMYMMKYFDISVIGENELL